uniref:Uncharacterized protein n=1 Tax=Rhizophora mucronata TaxID=61149 RepID=A0A2P2QBD4_RHIMU
MILFVKTVKQFSSWWKDLHFVDKLLTCESCDR